MLSRFTRAQNRSGKPLLCEEVHKLKAQLVGELLRGDRAKVSSGRTEAELGGYEGRISIM